MAMTENAARVDLLDPAHSLVLLKPTMAVPHGGGQKLEPESADYRVIADWIAHGAPAPKDEAKPAPAPKEEAKPEVPKEEAKPKAA